MDVNGGSSKPKKSNDLTEVHFTPGSVKFAIIHFAGDRNHAVTDQGRKVFRQGKIFIKEWNRYVTMAPYITHFIFEEKRQGYAAFQCTCGAFACVIGHQAYKDEMSATDTGELFVCHQHASTGHHLDGSEM